MRTKIVAVVFAVMCLLYAFHSMAKANEYHTTPEDFPQIDVTGEREGYLFISTIQFAACSKNNYAMILDGTGDLVYYKQFPDCSLVTDFKRQPDGSLTYWLGTQVAPGVFNGAITRMDNTYQVTNIYTSTGDYLDNHEFLVLPNGNVMLMYYRNVEVSNAAGTIPNGNQTAIIIGVIIREIAPNGDTVFQWNSWDHVDLTDADDLYLQYSPTDYIHSNAIDIDTDGNILLSSRHFNEVTKIDRKTGEIIWRLGGKRNEFDLLNDDRWFGHQHDVRRLPNGNLSLFDNGNNRLPPYSRYVEYSMDEEDLTLVKVREIQHTPGLFSAAMGSGRTQANGNVLIGWGAHSRPAISEYDWLNRVTFELSLPENLYTYRAYGDSWIGKPVGKPTAIVADDHLFFSWNGATEVAGYRIYAGGVRPETLIGTIQKNWFETSYNLKAGACTYRVSAIDLAGKVLGSSETVLDPKCGQIFFPVVHQ